MRRRRERGPENDAETAPTTKRSFGGVANVDDCTRCQRTTTLLVECQECHQEFCESHRSPKDHDCQGSSDDPDAAGAPDHGTADPRVLYPDDVGSLDRDPDDGTADESGDEEPLTGMDLDPTLGISRLLRTAGIVAAVLVVGLSVGGFLWLGPGTGLLDGNGTGAAQGASARAGDLNATRVEHLVHEYTNRERRDADVPAVEYDADLAAIAEYHSRDMAERDYVGHTNPDGESIADRYREFGYGCETNGEVIQWLEYDEVEGRGAEAVARTVVENWMISELHRSFVLNESWGRQGVGVHVADSGRVYVTQNTCVGSR